MRNWLRLTAFLLGSVGVGAAVSAGCASGDSKQTSNGLGGGGSGHGGGGAHDPGPGGSGGFTPSDAGVDGDSGLPACADFSAEAKPLPAAMLIVLDMTASMKVAVNNVKKYISAEQAIVTAIDQVAFDNTSIGLLTFPLSDKVCAPQCLCDFYGDPAGCSPTGCTSALYKVSCGAPLTPQIAPADSGTLKSTDSAGVRHNISTFLQTATPVASSDDGSPDYEALEAAYAALKATPNVDRRFAVLVSDGGFSCTSLSNPHRDGYDDGACTDWEEPDSVNALIAGAHNDPTTPINTFIVGVPGSNTNGGSSGMYANAPYPMLLALSTYAVSGSPDTVDATCDKMAVFTKTGQPPNFPCHIDLSNGAQFSAQALATAITKARNKALGCVYALPDPPPGKTINPNLVNVLLTLNGVESTVPRRADSSDMCASSDCWDFNAMNQVELIGQSCTEITTSAMAKIDIEVGCKTVIK